MSATLPERSVLITVVFLASVATVSACTYSNGRISTNQKNDREIVSVVTPDYDLAQTMDELFAQAKTLVEAETDTNLEAIELDIVGDDVIEKEVLRETGRLVMSQFSHPDFAERYLQQITTDQTGSYTALYVHHSKKVLVSKVLLEAYKASVPNSNISLQNKSVLALFLHELAHAADDQRFGIHDNREMNFKASFVQSATFEGHAQLLTRTICKKHECIEGMQSLENFMFEETPSSDPVVQSMQAISRNVLEYSYIEGERFLTELRNKENGEELVKQIMRNPPNDPIQILVPESFPNEARDSRNLKLRQTLTSVDHVWNTQDWAVIETSTIKGIDVRNNPERRASAIEGFAKLIDSMSAAQIFNQTSKTINPIDLMLIHTEDDSTALLFAESFATSSASVIEAENQDVDITINNSVLGLNTPITAESTIEGQPVYTELIIRPKIALESKSTQNEHYMVVLGMAGQYVVQISGRFNNELQQATDYARLLILALSESQS